MSDFEKTGLYSSSSYRSSEDTEKPVTVRITGVGIARVDPLEALRSQKARHQMDAVDALFERQKSSVAASRG